MARSTLNGDSNVGLGPSELFQLVDLSLRRLPRCPFIEPLATIAFAWSNIDDFAIGGNAINFNDETNVRGRLGLRLGTSYQVWPGTTMEPFVIGSVWSTLSGKNEVTLTSTLRRSASKMPPMTCRRRFCRRQFLQSEQADKRVRESRCDVRR